MFIRLYFKCSQFLDNCEQANLRTQNLVFVVHFNHSVDVLCALAMCVWMGGWVVGWLAGWLAVTVCVCMRVCSTACMCVCVHYS